MLNLEAGAAVPVAAGVEAGQVLQAAVQVRHPRLRGERNELFGASWPAMQVQGVRTSLPTQRAAQLQELMSRMFGRIRVHGFHCQRGCSLRRRFLSGRTWMSVAISSGRRSSLDTGPSPPAASRQPSASATSESVTAWRVKNMQAYRSGASDTVACATVTAISLSTKSACNPSQSPD